MLIKARNRICKFVQEIFGKIYYRKSAKKLKNHDFTILSSNCMGGILYHRFGKRFCSPTINLWMYEQDFQKFCLNIEYYKKHQLEFINNERKYPVANLGKDEMLIKIFFKHYKSKAEVEDKWNKRIQRIDMNNLFVIATDNDGMTEDMLKRWEDMKCRNIVVFTANEYSEIKYSFVLEKYRGNSSVGKYVNDKNKFTGIRYVEKVFDFARFFDS